jgi:tRNA-dihydrouridine synthase B
MLKIAHLEFSSPCILAPMAGITDLPYRLISRTFGCEFAFTEMISARALVCRSRNTERMLSSNPDDSPLGVQLLGNDPGVMLRALEILRKHSIGLIDVNAACPVSKVTKKGEGAAMLTEPRKLGQVLKTLVKHSALPVTVKIRSGWDEGSLNAGEVALRAQEAGVSAVFVHGRTRAQGYRGGVDYRIIREVKGLLRIPVIASGDTLSPQLIKKMFDETGCDGVAVARGALGNPWIFRQSAEYLASGVLLPKPGISEIIGIMTKHLNLCCDHYGEKHATVLFRKLFGWYMKGIPGVKNLRDRAFRAETKNTMLELIAALG